MTSGQALNVIEAMIVTTHFTPFEEEALEFAIKALQEKEESEKDFPCCNCEKSTCKGGELNKVVIRNE